MSLLVIALALGFVTSFNASAIAFPLWERLVGRCPAAARRSVLVAALPLIAGAAVGLAALVPGDPHLDTLLEG